MSIFMLLLISDGFQSTVEEVEEFEEVKVEGVPELTVEEDPEDRDEPVEGSHEKELFCGVWRVPPRWSVILNKKNKKINL